MVFHTIIKMCLQLRMHVRYMCIYGHYIVLLRMYAYMDLYVHCGTTSTNTVQFMRAHHEAHPSTCLLTPTHKHF